MKHSESNFKKKSLTIINKGIRGKRKKTSTKIKKEVFLKQKNDFSTNIVNKKRKVLNKVNKSRYNKRYNFKTRITMKENCSFCGQNINDIVFSLSAKVSGEDKPIHFECAFEKVKSENVLSDTEKIIYKGAGKFMIIDSSVRGENLAFKIVNELDFEEFDKCPEWRRKIFEQVNKDFDFY